MDSVGNPRDRMTKYTEFVTIFSSASGRMFSNISIHTEWNLFKWNAEYAENQALSGGVSAILRSGLILENIRRMFLLSIWVTGTMYMNFDENILRMFSRIRLDCRIALTPPERTWFSAYSARYLKKKNSIRYKSRYSKTSYLKRS